MIPVSSPAWAAPAPTRTRKRTHGVRVVREELGSDSGAGLVAARRVHQDAHEELRAPGDLVFARQKIDGFVVAPLDVQAVDPQRMDAVAEAQRRQLFSGARGSRVELVGVPGASARAGDTRRQQQQPDETAATPPFRSGHRGAESKRRARSSSRPERAAGSGRWVRVSHGVVRPAPGRLASRDLGHVGRPVAAQPGDETLES